MNTQEFLPSSELPPASITEAPARASDFVSYHALMLSERMDAESRMAESLVAALAAEERTAGRIDAAMDRLTGITEVLERATAAVDISITHLQGQSKAIAGMFREQLVKTDIEGVATLRAHLLQLCDDVAKSATVALNEAADEAGTNAELAALTRVTNTVVDQARASGMDGTIRLIAASTAKLNASVDRIEAVAQKAESPGFGSESGTQRHSSQRNESDEAGNQGLGFGNLAWLRLMHFLGTPGLMVVAVVTAFVAYKTLAP